MPEDITRIIVEATQQICELQSVALPESIDASTLLFGDGGVLDSLALVSLVIGVEEAIQERWGVAVGLADEKALSQQHSPYRTVGTLAAYATNELEARRKNG